MDSAVIWPNLLMSIIGLNIFLMGPQTDSDTFCNRINFIVTMILTSTTFKFAVDDATPSLSYLTLLDKWTLILFCLFFMSSLECTIIMMLTRWFDISPDFGGFCDIVCTIAATVVLAIATNSYIFDLGIESRAWWQSGERERIPVVTTS